MKTTIKLFLFSIIAVFLASCDIDRMPYDQIIIDNPDEGSASSITLGSYSKLKEEYFYKSVHYVNEYGADNVSLSGTTTDYFYYLYKCDRLPNNYYTARVWQFTYQTIVNVNALINTIKENQSIEMNHLLGENYFLRGYLYFTLGNIYGRPYVQSPNTNLSIPLKLTADITDFPPRATVHDVYTQIEKDLKKAAALMTVKKNNNYASKDVAWALLSRVNLYMGNWSNAEKYADSVINNGRYELLKGDAYQKYPTHVPETNKESIWVIRNVKDKDYNKYNMNWYSVSSMYAEFNGVGWGEMYPSWPYLNLINQNPSDLRHGFIKDQTNGDKEWLIYVMGNESKKSYNYVTNFVEKQGEIYVITENPTNYTSSTVQTEVINGKRLYYVVRKDDNKKYYVRIESAVHKRDAFPKRYIYKCSLQEGQDHLWSPVILRLGEIYLNRAEAKFHLNDLQGALDDVNEIRRRATIPEWTLATVPAGKTVLDLILEERRLEMAFEGHRKMDIYRNGLTLDRRYPGSHLGGEISSVHLTIEPTSKIIVEYIPQSEMESYPTQLEQNP